MTRNKLALLAAVPVIVCLTVYALAAFVCWQADPAEWDVGVRLMCVFIAVPANMGLLGILAEVPE